MPKARRNDKERELWVLNDEGLYNSWQRKRISMRKFLRVYRSSIDAYIDKALNTEPRG